MNQNQYCTPGEITEVSVTIQLLEDAGWSFFFTTSLFNSHMCPVQKTNGLWRMTTDYHKLNQVVILFAATAPRVVSLLKQINTLIAAYRVPGEVLICSSKDTTEANCL